MTGIYGGRGVLYLRLYLEMAGMGGGVGKNVCVSIE